MTQQRLSQVKPDSIVAEEERASHRGAALADIDSKMKPKGYAYDRNEWEDKGRQMKKEMEEMRWMCAAQQREIHM